jgi:hypothetical protein
MTSNLVVAGSSPAGGTHHIAGHFRGVADDRQAAMDLSWQLRFAHAGLLAIGDPDCQQCLSVLEGHPRFCTGQSLNCHFTVPMLHPIGDSESAYTTGYGAGWGDGWNEPLKAAATVLALADAFSCTHEEIVRRIETLRTGPLLTDAGCQAVDRWSASGAAQQGFGVGGSDAVAAAGQLDGHEFARRRSSVGQCACERARCLRLRRR